MEKLILQLLFIPQILNSKAFHENSEIAESWTPLIKNEYIYIYIYLYIYE